MNYLIPTYLKQGDTLLVIGISRARSEEQLAPALLELQQWGLKVETGPNLYARHHQFAGTDAQRAADLQWAIDHPQAKAVLIAGGGYGAMRIIDAVNFEALKALPKWVAGYSDATAVFCRLNKTGLAAIHSTMAFQLMQHQGATASLRKALFGEKLAYAVSPHPLNRQGRASAPVIGGNLSLLYAMSGSRDDLDTSGCILFIEDLDEQLYHLDRMMLQLKRSGKLSGLAGLVVGGMTEMKDNAVPYGLTANEIVWEAVREYSYPVCFDFPAGHVPGNYALYLNRPATLIVEEKRIELNY